MTKPNKNNKVLIVDDSSDISDVVQLVLRAEGYEVTLWNDGNSFEQIKKLAEKPLFILLDVLLAGADGRTLCKKLKNDAETKKIPVVMFSAYPHVKESVLEAGADAFLPKPFGRKDLLNIINRTLNSSK